VKYRDPVTDDELSRGEYISWMVQSIIRRWTFLGVVTLLTLLAWSTVFWLSQSGAVLTWWNLCASYLAIVIESIVGLAMFGQTRRDAVILRRIARMDNVNAAQLDKLVALEAATSQQTAMLVALLEKHEAQG